LRSQNGKRSTPNQRAFQDGNSGATDRGSSGAPPQSAHRRTSSLDNSWTGLRAERSGAGKAPASGPRSLCPSRACFVISPNSRTLRPKHLADAERPPPSVTAPSRSERRCIALGLGQGRGRETGNADRRSSRRRGASRRCGPGDRFSRAASFSSSSLSLIGAHRPDHRAATAGNGLAPGRRSFSSSAASSMRFQLQRKENNSSVEIALMRFMRRFERTGRLPDRRHYRRAGARHS